MSSPYILFFDTFNHDGVSTFSCEEELQRKNPEISDCIRFKSPVNLLEVRIIPFGSVIESNLSDEAIIGATNPAVFDITVYSNNQTNCITLHDIARFHFDEKVGINNVTFKEPINSNFLLFRGRYTTMTVALFGIPALPLTAGLLPGGPGIPVPPPTVQSIGQLVAPSTAGTGAFQAAVVPPSSIATANLIKSSNLPTLVMSNQVTDSRVLNVDPQWPPEASAPLEQTEDPTIEHDGTTLADVKVEKSLSSEDAILQSTSDLPGLYEDGEIQDIDYEEISSNEEVFSEPEDVDFDESTQFTEEDPRFTSCFWRFNPWDMAKHSNTGSPDKRHRLPDPALTVFEMHTWLLNRPVTDETLMALIDVQKGDDEMIQPDVKSTSTVERQQRQQEASEVPPSPPPNDWVLAAEAGQWLQAAVERFHPDAELHEEWVDEMEGGAESNLALGLAFISRFREEVFGNVRESLLNWVRVGLDLTLALRQPNATYIVRHLATGVRLTGLIVGTTSPSLAHDLLRPECQTHDRTAQRNSVQHLLLDLLESPLITTPLRLTICRALDQTTRLPVGFDAFLGRRCHESTDVCRGGHPVVRESSQASVKSEDFVEVNEPIKTEEEHATDDESVGRRTPYQRLICLFATGKNSRATSAFQRLVNKLHAYELLLDFQDLVQRVRTSTSLAAEDQQLLEDKLTAFLCDLTYLWVNAPNTIANPRKSLPCSILLDSSQLSYHDPYPTLCCLFDRTNLLDSVAWLTEQMPSRKPQSQDVEMVPGEVNSFGCTWKSPDRIACAIIQFISALLANPTGLGLLASREKCTSRLLVACLNVDYAEFQPLSELAICGLEMACKLDVYRSLDVLVAWARREGVTGVSTTIARMTGDQTPLALPTNKDETMLRQALFALARFCVSGLGSPVKLSGPETTDYYLNRTLTTSSPIWLAQVLTMDDFTTPLLMIIEGAATISSKKEQSTVTGSTDVSLTRNKSSESLKDTKSEGVGELPGVGDSLIVTSFRSTLKSLLLSPLEPVGLVNVVLTTVLRFGEDMTYFDKYGSRLVKLASTYSWEDCLEDSAATSFICQLRSFSHAAAPFLGWLRDHVGMMTHQSSTVPVLSLLQPTKSNENQVTPLSNDTFPWLLTQLPVLCRQMDEALDTVVDIDISEELSLLPAVPAPATTLPISERKMTNQSGIPSAGGIVSGHSLPPGLLILLRLLRASVIAKDVGTILETYSCKPLFMSHSLALIELYKANGLQLLSSLIGRLSDFVLLRCQISAASSISGTGFPPITCSCCSLPTGKQQSSDSCHLDPGHIANTVGGLVFALLDEAVQLVGVLLHAILKPSCSTSSPPSVSSSQFRDVTVARSLFLSYACTVYSSTPPGPYQAQMERLRRSTINALMAYINGGVGVSLAPKDVEKSLWVEVLRELVAFTVASPIYYLPGLRILLNLLPLPLPMGTISTIDSVSEQRLLTVRDLWAVHLLPIASELAGLIELLVATNLSPSANNSSNPFVGTICHPIHDALRQLIARLADLSDCANLLAEACLSTLLAVCDGINKKANRRTVEKGDTKTDEQISASPTETQGDSSQSVLSGSVGTATPAFVGSTPSVRLLLLASSSTAAGANTIDPYQEETDNSSIGGTRLDSEDLCASKQLRDLASAGTAQSVEVMAAFALLRLHLESPVCRLAIINKLKTAPLDRGDVTKDQFTEVTVSNRRKMLPIMMDDILSVLSDQPVVIQIQMMVLECIGLLLNSKMALFTDVSGDQPADDDSLRQRLMEGLPDAELCKQLAAVLIGHIDHPDRDMATLPAALQPLLSLTAEDVGFRIVVEALEKSALASSSGTSSGEQHFFASLLQRVNDCFSVENPACQATLAICLRLLQSLLLLQNNRISSSAPDTSGPGQYPGTILDTITDDVGVDSKLEWRQSHLSISQLRPLLGWCSNGGDEGKPVRDLHALLEMLADDEPSLEYLRTGMKNLLSLLSADFDAPQPSGDQLLTTCASAVKEPVTPAVCTQQLLSQLLKARRSNFLDLSGELPSEKQRVIANARRRLHDCKRNRLAQTTLNTGDDVILQDQQSAKLITCDLIEFATMCCKGMSIRGELIKCGRQRGQAEAAIRHQKRRRGQSSIIETGRSAKKFVAPMRGRGFMLRSSARGHLQANSSGGASVGPTGCGGSGPGSSGGGGRVDPFRNRPLNTSRPPSLHVDDFTKLLKDDGIEDLPRHRPYRDGRGFRGGRSTKTGGSHRNLCSGLGAPPSSSSLGSNAIPAASSVLPVPFGLPINPISQLSGAGTGTTTSLLPMGWPSMGRPLLPFDADSRSSQIRRDRQPRC